MRDTQVLELASNMRELQSVMADATDAQANAIQRDIHKLKHRVPNQYFLQVVDHAMQLGIGVALKHFQATRPCRALIVHEKRYFLTEDQTKGCPSAGACDDPW